MAFVFKSPKLSNDPKSELIPGPGTYVAHADYQIQKSYAPFLSTSARGKNSKKDEEPGPGSYNVTKDMSIVGKNNKFQVASIFTDPRDIEDSKVSSVFKSKLERFAHPQENDPTPGPGSYYKPTSFIKKQTGSLLINSQSNLLNHQKNEQALNLNKLKSNFSIPSIPSTIHGYGYTENDKHELMLNKNPLLEVQQYVGPGYYNHKDLFQANKSKGIIWHKSDVKRFADPNKKATENVGPGQYEVLRRSMPLYKLKPTAGFASSTQRDVFNIKEKKEDQNKLMSITTNAAINEGVGAKLGILEDEHGDIAEYIEDAIPGPGYYHNENIASSIKVSYKPYAHQFFGSGSERFPQWEKPKTNLGPGEYDPNYHFTKIQNSNEIKVPFASTDARFGKGNNQNLPGPGQYDPRINLRDKVIDKIRLGYRGNFGTTDRRFKSNDHHAEEIPGPGTYAAPITKHDNTKGAGYVFNSASKRDPTNSQKDEWPAPGSYDFSYGTIAKKVIKDNNDDGSELKPLRVHFNSTEPRFPDKKKVEADDEDHEPIITNKSLENLYKGKNNQKTSSVFASNSKRGFITRKDPIPGPGTYNDPVQAQWNKRTYNILFAEV